MSEQSGGSRSALVVTLITTVGVVLTAVLTFFGLRYQTEAPIRATQTAEARSIALAITQRVLELTPTGAPSFTSTVPPQPTVAPTATSTVPPPTASPPTVVVTVVQPYFTIQNKLRRAIEVSADDVYLGNVAPNREKSFFVTGFPVEVSTRVQRAQNADGQPIGEALSAVFNDLVNVGDTQVVVNKVGDQEYFWPIITNTLDVDCTLVINEGYDDQVDTGVVVPAHAEQQAVGYFKLYDDANVTLKCGDDTYWWGLRPSKTEGTSFSADVEADSGAIEFTVEP